MDGRRHLKLAAMALAFMMVFSLTFSMVSATQYWESWNGEEPAIDKPDTFQYEDLTIANQTTDPFLSINIVCKVCEYHNVFDENYATMTLKINIAGSLQQYLKEGDYKGRFWTGLAFFVCETEHGELSRTYIHDLSAVNLVRSEPATPDPVTGVFAEVIYAGINLLLSGIPGAAGGIFVLDVASALMHVDPYPGDQFAYENPDDSDITYVTFSSYTPYDQGGNIPLDQVTKDFDAWLTVDWSIYSHVDPSISHELTLMAYTYCYMAYPVCPLLVNQNLTAVTIRLGPDSTQPTVERAPGSFDLNNPIVGLDPATVFYPVNSIASHSISWDVSDSSVTSYAIQCGENVLQTGTRFIDEYSLIQSVDGLAEGNYVYTCTVRDKEERTTSDLVDVTVTAPDLTPPAIVGPSDITYELRTMGHLITWDANDYNPWIYSIVWYWSSDPQKTEHPVASGTWISGSLPTISVDNLAVGDYTYKCTVTDDAGNTQSSCVRVTVICTPPFFTSAPLSAYYYQRGATNKYLYWTAHDNDPSFYLITNTVYVLGVPIIIPIAGPAGWSSDQQISLQIPNQDLATSGDYRYVCSVFDQELNLATNGVSVYVRDPTITSVSIIDPPDRTWYFTSGGSMSIGFMVDVNAFPYDHALTSINKVQFTSDGSNWYDATWLSQSSDGHHNYYTWIPSLASGNPARSYTIRARVSVNGGSTYITSGPITVYVQYNPPPPPGGGGCPYLYVYNGTHYINEGLLDIHTGYTGSDLITTQVLAPSPKEVGGVYLLRLVEHPNTTSHIDQVKLYATLSNGKTIQLPFVSAIHSQYGNVLPQLLRSDDWRVEELGAKWNDGTSQSIDLRFLALPPWIHPVSFTFVIEGYNPYYKY